LPDLGISNLDDVLTDVRRITDVCDLPLLVDVDTGFGSSAFNVARTVKSMIKFGAAAIHIEDQVGAKRCGHRPGKEIVSQDEMADRVKAAADAKTDANFFIIARTDAIQAEGVDAAIERAIACVEAGADGIFAEAAYDLPTYQKFVDAVKVPVLASKSWRSSREAPPAAALSRGMASGAGAEGAGVNEATAMRDAFVAVMSIHA
jgi:methylisocitrate lyase